MNEENKRNSLVVTDLGLIDYQEAYQEQKKAVDAVQRGSSQIVFLCEHPAVLTLGRLAKESNILISPKELKQKKTINRP